MTEKKTFLIGKSGVYILYIGSHTYIGSAADLYYRLKKHINNLQKNTHNNKFMQNCFNKYKTVKYRILKLCERAELIKTECEYIIQYAPDLNIRHPNESRSGFLMSDESKEKIRKKLIGRSRPQEVVDKIALKNTGRKGTEEFKAYCKAKQANMSTETKRRISEANQYRILNESDVLNIRILLKEKIKLMKIAETYNVSYSTIYKIKTRARWKNI